MNLIQFDGLKYALLKSVASWAVLAGFIRKGAVKPALKRKTYFDHLFGLWPLRNWSSSDSV